MPSRWQIESVLSRIQAIRMEIERVAAKDHPYVEPSIVYRALLMSLDRSETKVRQALTLYALNPRIGDRASVVTLETEDKALRDVAAIFNLADRVDSARIPFEIIRALSWAAESLLEVPCHTIIRLDTVYTYSISSCREKFEEKDYGRYWKQAVEEAGLTVTNPVLLLGFPSTAAGSTLLHAIAAHEFAHVLKNERKASLSKSIDALAVSLTTKFCGEYNDALDGYSRDTIVRPIGLSEKEALKNRREQLEATITVTLRLWFTEVFSDLVAAKLVGPAFLAALDRLTPTSEDSPSRSHPPTSMRRFLVRDYLRAEMPELVSDDVWQEVLTSVVSGSEVELPWMICREVLIQAAPEIRSLINEAVPTSPFKWVPDLKNFIDTVADSFHKLSPPSSVLQLHGNVDDANYFWLLMFAAWRFRLDEDQFTTFRSTYGWNVSRAEEALSNILLHSLQSIELKSRWEQTHDTGLSSTSRAAQAGD